MFGTGTEQHVVSATPQSSFGVASPPTGIDLFVEAARLVAEQVEGVRFVIAGKPGTGYTLPPLSTLQGGSEFDVRARHIGNAETCELFQECSLVVLPYSQASQSGVAAIAFAFAKPVVATRVGGLGETVIDNVTGRLAQPGSPATLAGAIVELLRDPKMRSRIAEEIGRRAAGEWSWRCLAERTLSVYKAATSKS